MANGDYQNKVVVNGDFRAILVVVLAALIPSFIVGGITVYGTTKVMEARIDAMEKNWNLLLDQVRELRNDVRMLQARLYRQSIESVQ